MRVLVTGANGLVGQKIVEILMDRANLICIATGLGPCRIPGGYDYIYETMDASNVEDVRAVFETHKPTAVIHCAAMTNVDTCEKDPEGCHLANVVAVENLVNACILHDTKLIHISTDFIFDGTKGPYKEEDIPNPISIYGQSKLDAENVIINSKLKNWAIARTVLVYGVVPDMSRSNIVLWVKNSLENEKPITVVTDQIRTPTLAEDLAEGLVAILMLDKKGIYNLSGPDMISMYELAIKVANYWGLNADLISPITSDKLNQPAKRPPVTGFVLLKAQVDLNYKPRNLEESFHLLHKQLKS